MSDADVYDPDTGDFLGVVLQTESPTVHHATGYANDFGTAFIGFFDTEAEAVQAVRDWHNE